MPRRTKGWALLGILLAAGVTGSGATYRLVGWNDLGMHCTDGSDFSVFSILPHYNTIHAQLIRDGKLVKSTAGVTVSYEAVADAARSFNSTSQGKGNFYAHVKDLFGVALAPDAGLAGFAMPGPANRPQGMRFEAGSAMFVAEGIPITPYDDAGRKNYYPMMRLVARDAAQRVLASTDIVLPVSDEMDCRVCHASGAMEAARPAGGWAGLAEAAKDFKVNILRLHDDRHALDPRYAGALQASGYTADGLAASAERDGVPVLCARCHGSNALPGTGIPGVTPLTQAIHGFHAAVADPETGLELDHTANRASCYRCHPGSETRCLRGAMGNAVAADGSMSMQCQSCHGTMSQVAAPGRVGWLDQPSCAQCHTGTATKNNGQIRYASVFEADGTPRTPVNPVFGTTPGVPMADFDLYRFSKGHGGLQCEACHGPTHAEYPSSHANDNVQSVKLQGHVGTLVECSACHSSVPETVSGGPHGMHPVGQKWIEKHGDAAEDGRAAQCKACHGTDYRGTVLSRMQADRSVEAFGKKRFFRGSEIGCYNCHRGPSNDDASRNRAPVVSSFTLQTPAGTPLKVTLAASDADREVLRLRIVSQPAHGTVALEGNRATFYPEPGFTGTDQFTYAARDGSTDSNLGKVQIQVYR